jgi:hypothetical protein
VLYCGLDSALALGQGLYGLLCLLLAWRAPAILEQGPFLLLTAFAVAGWLAINLAFVDFWKPKVTTVIFSLLLAASLIANL